VFLARARKGQKIPNDIGDAFPFVDNTAQNILFVLGYFETIGEQLRIIDDAVDGIVDFVGHPGSKFAQRCELPGSQGFLAQLHLVSDVAGIAYDLHRIAGLVFYREGANLPAALTPPFQDYLLTVAGAKTRHHRTFFLATGTVFPQGTTGLARDLSYRQIGHLGRA
jgi:hypothetical protein